MRSFTKTPGRICEIWPFFPRRIDRKFRIDYSVITDPGDPAAVDGHKAACKEEDTQ